MNKRRATGKYTDRAGEKPFIGVGKGCLREYILKKLKEVEATLMGLKHKRGGFTVRSTDLS